MIPPIGIDDAADVNRPSHILDDLPMLRLCVSYCCSNTIKLSYKRNFNDFQEL